MTASEILELLTTPFIEVSVDDVYQTLKGQPASRIYTLWINKPPGSPQETPPHQDNAQMMMMPPRVVTIWLALDDVDESNACLFHIPGSQHRGFRPLGKRGVILDFGPDDVAAGVPIILKAGDAVAHHGTTIHWSGRNTSTRNRRAIQMVFRGASCIRTPSAFQRGPA